VNIQQQLLQLFTPGQWECEPSSVSDKTRMTKVQQSSSIRGGCGGGRRGASLNLDLWRKACLIRRLDIIIRTFYHPEIDSLNCAGNILVQLLVSTLPNWDIVFPS
jgi:hypothetical protein